MRGRKKGVEADRLSSPPAPSLFLPSVGEGDNVEAIRVDASLQRDPAACSPSRATRTSSRGQGGVEAEGRVVSIPYFNEACIAAPSGNHPWPLLAPLIALPRQGAGRDQ